MNKLIRLCRHGLHKVTDRWRTSRQLDATFAAFVDQGVSSPVFYDIGARWGISKPYNRLRQITGFCSVGFEPDAEEAERLRRDEHFDIVCPVALGDCRGLRTLYIAEDPGCSSLFPPDMAEAARHTVSKQFATVNRTQVAVETLDDVVKERRLPPPDYIKVDCEGAEELILAGGHNTLRKVIGLTVEARLVEFYKGGATLASIMPKLMSMGFVCLRCDSVGSFFDTQVMFDIVMIRHPESYVTIRDQLLGQTFSLLHGSRIYAQRIACLTSGINPANR